MENSTALQPFHTSSPWLLLCLTRELLKDVLKSVNTESPGNKQILKIVTAPLCDSMWLVQMDALVPAPGTSGLGLRLLGQGTEWEPTLQFRYDSLLLSNSSLSVQARNQFNIVSKRPGQPESNPCLCSCSSLPARCWPVLGSWGLKAFSLQFLFCDSISKSEVLFITSVVGEQKQWLISSYSFFVQ